MISSEIKVMGIRRYSYLVSCVPKYFFNVNAHVLGLERRYNTITKNLSVVVSKVGVLTYPGYSTISPQLLTRYGWVHLFEGISIPKCVHM